MRFIIVLLMAIALAGCRTPAKVQEYPDQAIVRYDDKVLSEDEVGRAIMMAGAELGWLMKPVETGHIVGSLAWNGKHTAIVDIFFDSKTYSILYKDSINLDYNAISNAYVPKHSIHPGYNRQVTKLVNGINVGLQRVE